MAKIIDDETMENVCILAKLSLSEEEKEKAKSLKRGMRFSSHYLEDPSLRKLQWNLSIKKVDSQCSVTE